MTVADGPRVLAWPAFFKQQANPHAALLARALIRQGIDLADWTPLRALLRPRQLWHLHHPETVLYRRNFLASALETLAFFGLLAAARARGTRVLWTIHDLGSNDGLHPRLEAWFWKVFTRRIDAFICLSERGRQLAIDRYPTLASLPACVVPHGHYLEAYPQTVTREEARAHLALPSDATVLLHFGLIRPYKNVPHLIHTFHNRTDRNAVLLIAGRPFDRVMEQDVRTSAEGVSNVRLNLHRIPDEDVQRFFAASDLVVLPYRRITNSGALMLALTFARPVLVPDLGVMREQQETFGSDWIRLYAGDLATADLSAAVTWARHRERRPIAYDAFDWRRLASRTGAVYDALTRRDPRESWPGCWEARR